MDGGHSESNRGSFFQRACSWLKCRGSFFQRARSRLKCRGSFFQRVCSRWGYRGSFFQRARSWLKYCGSFFQRPRSRLKCRGSFFQRAPPRSGKVLRVPPVAFSIRPQRRGRAQPSLPGWARPPAWRDSRGSSPRFSASPLGGESSCPFPRRASGASL